MIRPATLDDIPRIIELGRQFHAESPEFSSISFDVEKLTETLKACINGAGVVFLYESAGTVRGGLAGVISEYWFSREKVALDLALFLEPEARTGMIALKLVLTFKSWARLMGATEVKMGITAGINVEGAAKLYASTGMDQCGFMFKERIQ